MVTSPKVEGHVVIPVEVFLDAETMDEIEDWLMLQNEEIMTGLVEARRQHLAGDLVSIEEVKAKLGL